MIARALRLRNVRSRTLLDLDFGPGLNILFGPNGAGKTTVLEATVIVLNGGLLRPGSVRDLIKRGQDHLRVEIDLEDEHGVVTAAAAYAGDGERRLTAGGAPLTDHARWEESLPVRSFVPDDLRLIKGSPRRRRQYLDTLTARQDPEYAGLLRQYEEALAQRNTLLRMGARSSDEGHFTPWEKILADAGLEVSRRRGTTLAGFVGSFQRMYHDLTGEPADSLRIVYRTNVADLDRAAYAKRLAQMRSADRQRTFTHLGPHRDDFRLTRASLDMRDCASQGEQRAALLTLVLAEWEYLRDKGQRPLLLLDDVMSELDETRRRALVRAIRKGGQSIVTTTDLRYFKEDELEGSTVIDLGDTKEEHGKER
jgi:DNA replication and repair protein RecF